jgi:phage recombination protein Bet
MGEEAENYSTNCYDLDEIREEIKYQETKWRQSMNDLTVKENEVTENKLIQYLDSVGATTQLKEHEKKMFINIAREFNLNPFKREIHVTAYGEGQYRNLSIITGYEVYIKRAERTGNLDGWKCWTEGSGENLTAKIEIYRKDQAHPFQYEVYFPEACQYKKDGTMNSIWKKMPRFMLKKVCIGQGFRLCFSDELGGIPYEPSEIGQEEPRDVTPPTPQLKPQNEAEERETILNQTAEILKSKDGNGLNVFTETEIAEEHNVAKEAKGIEELYDQHDRLDAERCLRVGQTEEIAF